MTRHLPGTSAHVGPALLAAVEHRRADRRVIACIVAEVVLDPADGTAWVVLEHGIATGVAVAPAAVLHEVARALERADGAQEEHLQ